MEAEIARRGEVEAALRRSLDFQRALIEAIPTPVFYKDLAGRYLGMNRAFVNLYGRPEADLVGKRVHEIVPKEQADVFQAADERLLENPGQAHYESPLLAADGRVHEVVFHKSTFTDETGAVAGVIGVAEDITERKQAATALRESEERYRNFVANASEGIFRIDFARPIRVDLPLEELEAQIAEHAVVAEVNAALAAMYQLQPEDMVGRPVREFAPNCGGQMADLFRRPDCRIVERPEQEVQADGSPLYIVESYFGVVQDGVLVRVWGVQRNDTERRKAEIAVRESEERYRILVENNQDGVFVLRQGKFAYVNQAFARLLDLPAEAIVGRPLLELVAPEDRELVGHRHAARVQGQRVVDEYECRALRGAAQTRIIVHVKVGVLTLQGETTVIATLRDVTQQRRAENELRTKHQELLAAYGQLSAAQAELRRSYDELARSQEALRANEERIRTLTENSPDMIFRVNLQTGAYEYVNPASVAVCGYAPEEVYREPLLIRRVIHPEWQDYFAEQWSKLLRGEAPPVYEFQIIHACGEPRWLLQRNTLVKDASGAPVALEGVVTDITDRKRAEAERIEFERRLLHAQKLESLGVLAGGIAHDFNNLLMAVLGNLDMTLLGLPADSAVRPDIERAMQATRRATDLTRQMLAYSGRGRVTVARLNLNDLVRENAGLFGAAAARSVVIELRLAVEPLFVEADAGQLQQIVMNLITNASEAIGERPGRLTLSTGARFGDEALLARSRLEQKPAPGRFVYLEVEDDGCGMDEATVQRIFDPFFTTKFTGRGLGMSATLGIVRAHKGAILIDSEPGRGTRISVLFPAARPAALVAAPEAVASGPSAAGRGRTVLVVDDEDTVRTLCARFAERLGYRVLCAADGEEAVAVFAAHAAEIDCVLLDLTMPRMDGVQAFQEMRRLRPDVKVILCSGYTEQDAVQRFQGAGLAGFIQKPYRLQELQDILARAFGDG